MIEQIEIVKLKEHPNNPRESLGDLTELAESIKQNGILQNLTVVPWTAEVLKKTKSEKMMYTVVIGHRRLAAAKLAGLTEVPCTIAANMDERTQISTMLLENMQRADLTLWEQARGFQMMLDFGESVNDISDKTGFSESTVRRRVKLLDLDKDKFKESIERGAPLLDYIELDKIKDTKRKNEVLEAIGTDNFTYELRRAINAEETERKDANLKAELNKFATEISDADGLRQICYVFSISKIKDFIGTEDVNYFYTCPKNSWESPKLYSDESIEINSAPVNNPEDEARSKKRKEIITLSEIAFKNRYDFVRNISNTTAKKNISIIVGEAIKIIMDEGYNYKGYEQLTDAFNITPQNSNNVEFSDIEEQLDKKPELFLLMTIYAALDGINTNYVDWWNMHDENEELNEIYNLLEKLGYQMSDVEKQLKDGTHELFDKSKEETEENKTDEDITEDEDE